MSKNTFDPLKKLPVGAIKPEGWLKDQLMLLNELQKKLGTSKSMIKDGGWAGDEALPRYARGLILLAGVLQNEKQLREKVDAFMNPIFLSANEGGDFGPKGGKFISPKIEGIKAVMSYYELTGDTQAFSFLKKFFKNQFNTFSITPCWSHSRARLLEEVPAIEFVYRQTDQEWLKDLAEQLREASTDWIALSSTFKYRRRSGFYINFKASAKLRKFIESYEAGSDDTATAVLTKEVADVNWKKAKHRAFVETNGVNLAKAIKYPTTYGSFIGDPDLKRFSMRLVSNLEKYHGTGTGMFTCDYRLGGKSPSRGMDVVAEVEMIESLLYVLQYSRDYNAADYMEKILYNAVSSALLMNTCAVQEIGLANQTESAARTKEYFKETAYGNAYTINRISRTAIALLSSYPLYMQSLCMQGEGELNFFSYAPCTIRTVVDGVNLVLKEETSYPFRNKIIFRVESVDGEPEIKLNFRVPRNTTMQVISGGDVVASGSRNISVKCILKTGSTFTLKLDIPLIAQTNPDRSISLYKGSILMAEKVLPITTVSKDDPSVLNMVFSKKWNISPVLAKKASSGIRHLYNQEKVFVSDFTNIPFNHEKPPFELHVLAKNVENWDYDANGFVQIPKKPNFSEESIERVFVPYGCTALHISQFPLCVR